MTVRVERDGPVWTVVLARPEKRNAVDRRMAEDLHRAFVEFDRDDAARVAVLWGEGGAFCSGWDLDAASDLTPDSLGWMEFPVDGHDYPISPMGATRLELSKPVIAAIAGPAVAGGMELALWCDFRVMEDTAYMGVYNRRWGVPLVDGGTVRLPRLVGEGRALELVLTGRKVEASECKHIGLAEYVVNEGSGRTKAETLAADIARFPQGCVRSDRRSAMNQAGLPLREALTREWSNSRHVIFAEGVAGAERFREGDGRHGQFGEGPRD